MMTRGIGCRAARRGFTLIELLVVIAIIAVLMGLLMAGVMAVMQARERAANRYDLDKLSSSLDVAMQEYSQTKTLPGYLVLYNNTDVYRKPTTYLTTAGDVKDAERSRDALRKMFGSRFITNGGTVPWDGTNGTAVTNKVTLEGQQCLVFYLGGNCDSSSGTPGMRGFSKNPTNPLDFSTKERFGPYYNFESTRLVGNKQYPSYADRYGTPYAYFGGTGGSNSYVGGCPSLGVSAYQESATKWTRPDSFQIISAGKDKKFGAGGLWDPTRGSTDLNARDDVSNFSSGPLSNPLN